MAFIFISDYYIYIPSCFPFHDQKRNLENTHLTLSQRQGEKRYLLDHNYMGKYVVVVVMYLELVKIMVIT